MFEFGLVDIRAIHSEVPRSNFPEDDIETLADLIIKAEGLARPLILKQDDIESFSVLNGHFEYHAASRAKEKNIEVAEMVNAFIIPIKSNGTEAIVAQQMKILGDRSQQAPVPVVSSALIKTSHSKSPESLTNLINSFETRFRNLQEEMWRDRQSNDHRLKTLEKTIVNPQDPLYLLNTLDEKALGIRLARAKMPKPEKMAKALCTVRQNQEGERFESYLDLLAAIKGKKVGLGEKRLLVLIDAWSRA